MRAETQTVALLPLVSVCQLTVASFQ